MRNITAQIIASLMRSPKSRRDLAIEADASLQSVDRLLADLLTGEPIYKQAYVAREYEGICGQEARDFEPKPVPRWWEFWK